MDSEIWVAVISGLFGAVIAPLIDWFIKRPRPSGDRTSKAPPPAPSPRRSLSPALLAGVGGVIGVLVGLFLLAPLVPSCSFLEPATVTITSPVAGARASRLTTVRGSACRIPSDKELWLLVLPQGVTSYYPQAGPIAVSTNGLWSASAYLGLDDPVDVGKEFVVIAALADQRGGAAIRTYFAQSGAQFQGLEPLPQGVQVMTQVPVVRTK